jgi:hypothetical protein
MRKMLLLPLIAVGVLASQAGAADCKYNGATSFCGYPTGCYKLSDGYSNIRGVCCGSQPEAKAAKDCTTPDVLCDCEKINEACIRDGALFTGVREAELSPANNYGEGVVCANVGGTEQAGSQCKQNGQDAYCWWEEDSKCEPIRPGYGSDNCTDAIAECNSYGAIHTTSNCGGASSPIATGVYSVANLTVLAQQGSLHISSQKDVSVSLFDMNGKQVFSQNVAKGYNTLSLNGYKQGVYFAVVSSGSSKQTVRIVLK